MTMDSSLRFASFRMTDSSIVNASLFSLVIPSPSEESILNSDSSLRFTALRFVQNDSTLANNLVIPSEARNPTDDDALMETQIQWADSMD